MSNASPSDLGASQQTPNDSASEANRIAFAVERILARLDIAKPVKVVAVHAGSGTPPGACTVDVQPLVSQLDGNNNAVEQGTVYGIPVLRQSGNGWTVVIDPKAGDFGFVVCADRDISTVAASPGVGKPGSNRRFSISDGIFVGGILNNPRDGESYLWLRDDGTFKLAAAGGLVLESDTNGKLTLTGDLDVTGQVTAHSTTPALKVTLTQHRHSANNTPPTPGF